MTPHHKAWLKNNPNMSYVQFRELIMLGFEVHHLDHNHDNNDPDNLILIWGDDHKRVHETKKTPSKWRNGVNYALEQYESDQTLVDACERYITEGVDMDHPVIRNYKQKNAVLVRHIDKHYGIWVSTDNVGRYVMKMRNVGNYLRRYDAIYDLIHYYPDIDSPSRIELDSLGYADDNVRANHISHHFKKVKRIEGKLKKLKHITG